MLKILKNVDTMFVENLLKPYLSDLYKDLLMRSNKEDVIDKVTFIEYTKLPGIINDRLHIMFSTESKKSTSKSPEQKIKGIVHNKKDEYVNLVNFVEYFRIIFIGNL